MVKSNKTGKTLSHTKDQTPFLTLSGSQKVVRTPTNPFEEVVRDELFVPKEIIARMAKWNIRVRKQSCKQVNHLIL
jgi:hypothetical protein